MGPHKGVIEEPREYVLGSLPLARVGEQFFDSLCDNLRSTGRRLTGLADWNGPPCVAIPLYYPLRTCQAIYHLLHRPRNIPHAVVSADWVRAFCLACHILFWGARMNSVLSPHRLQDI